MADFQLTGAKELEEKLGAIAMATPNKLAAALDREAQIEMTESKKRVPVDTGALRSSGVVQKPVFDGKNVSVKKKGDPKAALLELINLEINYALKLITFLPDFLSKEMIPAFICNADA